MNVHKKLIRIFFVSFIILIAATIISSGIYFCFEKVNGTVTEVITMRKPKKKVATICYSINGKDYTKKIDYTFHSPVKKGDNISLRVNRNAPEIALDIKFIIFFFVADIIIGLTLLMLVKCKNE